MRENHTGRPTRGSRRRGRLPLLLLGLSLAILVACRYAAAAPLATATFQGTVYYDANGNGVRDPGEVALADAAIRANLLPAAMGTSVYSTRADANGHYTLTMPAGTVGIAAQLAAQGALTDGAVLTRATVGAGQSAMLDLGLLRPTFGPASRYFPQTGYGIDNPAIWSYFSARSGVATFGYPVSETFRLLGFTVQCFQRQVLQVFPDGSVHPLNVLDPGLFPITSVNFSTFPAYDPAVASAAPPPDTPDYGQAVLRYLRATVPDTFEGRTVNFLRTYLAAAPPGSGGFPALVALDVYGFPTSQPAVDPHNANFVYQRFQRGILHYDAAGRVTSAILLADAFKHVLLGQQMPADVASEVQGSRFLKQYCPGPVGWTCDPGRLPASDLTFAFEQERLER